MFRKYLFILKITFLMIFCELNYLKLFFPLNSSCIKFSVMKNNFLLQAARNFGFVLKLLHLEELPRRAQGCLLRRWAHRPAVTTIMSPVSSHIC